MTIRKPCAASSTWGPCKYEEGHAGPHCAEIISNIADLTNRRVENAAAFRAAYEVEAACAREVQEATERLHRAQAESVRLRDLEEEAMDRLRAAESERDEARAEVERLRSSTGGLLLVRRHEIARAVGLPEDAPGHEVVAAVRSYVERYKAAVERGVHIARVREEARAERDEATARAERAEAQLAALREASAVIPALYRDISESSAVVPLSPEQWSAFCAAVSDSKAAADEHDRRVRAEALEEAADAAGKHHFAMGGLAGAEKWLRERAERIRRGER